MRSMFKKRRHVFLILAIAAMATATPAVSTAADNSTLSPYLLRTFAGKCLDVRDSSYADGAPIIQFHCTGGLNQRFGFTRYPDDTYSFVTAGAHKCLDVAGSSTADGAPIIQYACTAQPNQRFLLVPPSSGKFEIRTLAGKCLDVRGSSTADRAQIIQFRCTGQPNQQFEVG